MHVRSSPFITPFDQQFPALLPPELQQQLEELLDQYMRGQPQSDQSRRMLGLDPRGLAQSGQGFPFQMDADMMALLLLWFGMKQSENGGRNLGSMNGGGNGGGGFSNGAQPVSWSPQGYGRSGGSSGVTNNNGGGGGGQLVNGNPVTTSAPPGTKLHANVPWISQFNGQLVEDAGAVACYRACRAMMQAAGLNQPAGLQNRIQVATGEDGAGRATVDPMKAKEAQSFIDQQLEAGRPVTVGVTYKDADYNEGITDHFVVINGKGVDEQGRVFYTYQDPGTTDPSKGSNRRFYVDSQTGNLYDPSSAFGSRFDVAMVVPAS